MPAIISKNKYKQVLGIAKKAHHALGCRGVTRTDFKFFNDKFYILEINTQPGLTKNSLLPEMARNLKINFFDLCEIILANASCER